MNQCMMSVLAVALSLLSGCGDSGNQSAPLHSTLESVAVSSKDDNIESYDTDADGTADRIYTYSYDESGRLLTGTRDTDGDGSANEISHYNRDSNGVLMSQSCDDDADGKPDRIVGLGHCGYL
jgi:YD repeat-containing protein